MRVGLNEKFKLTIASFIKGISLNLTSKVDLQASLSFDDICNLAIMVEKQLKGGS